MNFIFISSIFVLVCASAVQSAPQTDLRALKGTPQEFLEAATTAATGIHTALQKAATDIHSVLAEDEELAGKVQSVLDVAFINSAGILMPALEALEVATTDEEAETIVTETLAHLMFIGLDTEFKVENVIIGADEVIQNQLKEISATLTTDVKAQVRPLWDLTQTKHH